MNSHSIVIVQQSFGSFWDLVLNTGPIGQLVLLILLFFSILSWTIIVRKMRSFREIRRQTGRFYEHFQQSESLSQIYRECQQFPMSPLAGVFKSAYAEMNQQMAARDETKSTALHSINGVQRSLQRAALAEMTALEKSLNWLATTGSVTPFIGLFGTVVGIINAFQGLGSGAATTIQAVAPGISEALVATAAGLFAAIPAVIGYNHFLSDLKVFAAEMDDFSAELLNLIERSFT